MKSFSAILLLSTLVQGLFLTAASASESSVVPVEVSANGSVSKISATVVPFREVMLTAQVAGRVEQVAGIEGDAKRAGDLLVAIDDDELVARRQAVQAQMSNAHSMLENARVQYNRELYSPRSESLTSMPGMALPTLFDNVFTRNMGDAMGYGDSDLERHADLHSAMTVVNQAQSALLQAQSELQELDSRIMDARSMAPFDGVMLRKMVEVGDTVQPGQPLVSFGHIAYLRLQAEVPTSVVGSLSQGQMVTATLGKNDSVAARVAQIYPVADAVRHTVTVKFDLPQGTKASPGLYAEVDVPIETLGQRKQIIIPTSALIPGRSLPSVLVISEQTGSMMKLVRLGQRLADERVVVLSGLSASDHIVDHPPAGVKSGWVPER